MTVNRVFQSLIRHIIIPTWNQSICSALFHLLGKRDNARTAVYSATSRTCVWRLQGAAGWSSGLGQVERHQHADVSARWEVKTTRLDGEGEQGLHKTRTNHRKDCNIQQLLYIHRQATLILVIVYLYNMLSLHCFLCFTSYIPTLFITFHWRLYTWTFPSDIRCYPRRWHSISWWMSSKFATQTRIYVVRTRICFSTSHTRCARALGMLVTCACVTPPDCTRTRTLVSRRWNCCWMDTCPTTTG